MAVLLFFLLLADLPPGSHGKLRPADAASDSFKQFRTRLLEAVEKKDLPFIISILDPQVTSRVGGDGGVQEFRKTWKLDKPEKGPMWGRLGEVLRMGGGFQKYGQFCAPYVFATWPESLELDVSETVAVISEKAAAHAEPDEKSPVVATYSYDILQVAPESDSPWRQIILSPDKRAYILRKHIRSPIDYRACFSLSGGHWLMTSLVAGD